MRPELQNKVERSAYTLDTWNDGFVVDLKRYELTEQGCQEGRVTSGLLGKGWVVATGEGSRAHLPWVALQHLKGR